VPASRPPHRRRRWSARIVRVAGIDIRVHATFPLLLGLVAWSNAAVGEPVLPALGWIVVLFACVVVHELAHSIVARHLGIQVHEIDLLPIGGLSRLERLPARWDDELRIAAAGPLASIGLAALACAVALAAGVPVDPPALVEGPIVARLVWVNLLLAGFNLLPAFPMDGGRVLRALLQRRTGRVEATQIAVRCSRILVAAFVVVGLVVDPWLLLIALFVHIGGRAELLAVQLHEVLAGIPVASLVRPCPAPVDVDVPAARALVAVGGRRAPVPVVDHAGRVVGAVDAGDLWRAGERPVGRIARPAIVVGVAGTVADVLDAPGAVAFAGEGDAVVGYVDPVALERVVEAATHRIG
jgi:Zn-dependent protease